MNELLRYHVDSLGDFNEGEAAMLPWLVGWLVATGRVRSRTSVAYEVPWLGRRVDLALLTARGVTSAFELKLGRLQRVLEQASYNDLSFHRSWAVVGSHPQPDGLDWAKRFGLGLLVVRPPVVTPLLLPVVRAPDATVIRRVRQAIATRASLPV
jgi:hypothetical protein